MQYHVRLSKKNHQHSILALVSGTRGRNFQSRKGSSAYQGFKFPVRSLFRLSVKHPLFPLKYSPTGTYLRKGPAKEPNSLYFSLLAGNLDGEVKPQTYESKATLYLVAVDAVSRELLRAIRVLGEKESNHPFSHLHVCAGHARWAKCVALPHGTIQRTIAQLDVYSDAVRGPRM